ncbi:hypothetical protein [Pseudophaeobacter sp.]|uniref:hypothetical protein n=1 Tax=Pseudophaeobacter sp. TaxID=1971739 RepID=UPI0032697075
MLDETPPPSGHNNPPHFDAEKVANLDQAAVGFLDTAGTWIEGGEIKSDDQAELLNDFIVGIKKRVATTEEARKADKKPHDDAGKAVQAAYKPITTKLEAAKTKVTPLLTAWLEKKEAAKQVEIQRQQEEARKAQQEADRKAAAAASRNDISGEIDADAAKDKADQLAKEAERAAKTKTNVGSATGGGRSATLRTTLRAEISNSRAAFMRYAEAPELLECLRTLAEREARAKGFDPDKDTIPGVTIHKDRKAV